MEFKIQFNRTLCIQNQAQPQPPHLSCLLEKSNKNPSRNHRLMVVAHAAPWSPMAGTEMPITETPLMSIWFSPTLRMFAAAMAETRVPNKLVPVRTVRAAQPHYMTQLCSNAHSYIYSAAFELSHSASGRETGRRGNTRDVHG